MQKVLVSAGAVGAAALELNNNQATEVVEAAPHGVQQRRRSQAKKEEPAVLIKRGHTTAKVHHGNSAARVQNGATVFWIVFGIIGILGLALGLGLGLGLPGDLNCRDLSKASDKSCTCGASFAGTQVKCTLDTKDDYQKFVDAKCTSITGTLNLDKLIVQTGQNIVEKVQFKDLIEVTGSVIVDRLAATQTTEKIVFDRLVKVGANIRVIGAVAGTGDADFVEFKTPCLKTVVNDVDMIRSCEVKNTDFGNLETVNRLVFQDFGSKTSATYRFGKLNKAAEIYVQKQTNTNKENFHFTADSLEVSTKIVMNFGPQNNNQCPNDILGFRFPAADKLYVPQVDFEGTLAGSQTGTMRFGSGSSLTTQASNWPSTKQTSAAGAGPTAVNNNNDCAAR